MVSIAFYVGVLFCTIVHHILSMPATVVFRNTVQQAFGAYVSYSTSGIPLIS